AQPRPPGPAAGGPTPGRLAHYGRLAHPGQAGRPADPRDDPFGDPRASAHTCRRHPWRANPSQRTPSRPAPSEGQAGQLATRHRQPDAAARDPYAPVR
ncbi:MAG: hypothetical protein ACOYEV_12580, partial [Candidatus Nanopelagicales bacterium]